MIYFLALRLGDIFSKPSCSLTSLCPTGNQDADSGDHPVHGLLGSENCVHRGAEVRAGPDGLPPMGIQHQSLPRSAAFPSFLSQPHHIQVRVCVRVCQSSSRSTRGDME